MKHDRNNWSRRVCSIWQIIWYLDASVNFQKLHPNSRDTFLLVNLKHFKILHAICWFPFAIHLCRSRLPKLSLPACCSSRSAQEELTSSCHRATSTWPPASPELLGGSEHHFLIFPGFWVQISICVEPMNGKYQTLDFLRPMGLE